MSKGALMEVEDEKPRINRLRPWRSGILDPRPSDHEVINWFVNRVLSYAVIMTMALLVVIGTYGVGFLVEGMIGYERSDGTIITGMFVVMIVMGGLSILFMIGFLSVISYRNYVTNEKLRTEHPRAKSYLIDDSDSESNS